jgi:hypothetical protein
MKTIFLDLDGIVAGHDYFERLRKEHKEIDFIDEEKIKLINTLDCNIVISSSWGEDGGRTERRLREKGLTLPIIGHTEHFWNNWICRGNEIAKWIEDNVQETDDFEYCIVDDDTDMLLSQKEHFVHVNERYGITEKDIKKIKKILDGNK